MKAKLLITTIIVFIFSSGYSQYAHFSQFYASPTILAPSFAGSTEHSRIVANYRDQWPSIPGTFVTFAASYDQNFYKINSGLGFLVLKDQAGDGELARTDFGVMYSWYTPIVKREKIYFRPGVQVKMSQRSLKYQKLVFGDQLPNPDNATMEPIPDTRSLYIDATASVLIYGPQFWIGTTVDHLFKPDESLTGNATHVDMKYSVFGGYKFYVGKATRRRAYAKDNRESLTASFYYRQQGGSGQFDIGGYWNHDPFTLGVWIRGMPIMKEINNTTKKTNLDAVVFLVGYKIFNFTVGYSYDLTVSDMLGTTGGAHEISLIYEFEAKTGINKRHSVISCPKF